MNEETKGRPMGNIMKFMGENISLNKLNFASIYVITYIIHQIFLNFLILCTLNLSLLYRPN